MSTLKLSVVIPAFNEEENLKNGCLNEVDEYLSKQPYSYEVVVVDDGSTDETVELVEKKVRENSKFMLIKNPHGGKANTVMRGLVSTKGLVVVFTDLDQSTPIKEIEKFFPKFDEGFDMVIGSRSGRAGAPLVRRLSAFGFVVLRRLILGLPFSDTQCGFKAFNQKAIKAIFPQMMSKWRNMKVIGAAVNAGFDVEMLFMAKKEKLKIAEVGVEWHYVGSERVPFFKSAADALKDILRIRINDWLGKYD